MRDLYLRSVLRAGAAPPVAAVLAYLFGAPIWAALLVFVLAEAARRAMLWQR